MKCMANQTLIVFVVLNFGSYILLCGGGLGEHKVGVDAKSKSRG